MTRTRNTEPVKRDNQQILFVIFVIRVFKADARSVDRKQAWVEKNLAQNKTNPLFQGNHRKIA